MKGLFVGYSALLHLFASIVLMITELDADLYSNGHGNPTTNQPSRINCVPVSCFSSIQVDKDLLSCSSLTRALGERAYELGDDPDKDYTLCGISKIFEIVPNLSLVKPVDCKNDASALTKEAKPAHDDLFAQEVAEGKLTIQSQKPHRIHAIVAVEKKGSTSLRSIADCSRPESDPLNASIETESSSLESLDDALRQSLPDCFLALFDPRSAYRYVPVT